MVNQVKENQEQVTTLQNRISPRVMELQEAHTNMDQLKIALAEREQKLDLANDSVMDLTIQVAEIEKLLERIKKEYIEKFQVKEQQLKTMAMDQELRNKWAMHAEAIIDESLANPLCGSGLKDMAGAKKFKEINRQLEMENL